MHNKIYCAQTMKYITLIAGKNYFTELTQTGNVIDLPILQ